MKSYSTLLFILCFCFTASLRSQTVLPPCPNSPNCVSTQAVKKQRRMAPIPFSGDASTVRKQILEVVEPMPGAKLVKGDQSTLHFTFVTKVGKFIDDVTFFIDSENQLIHFHSASRKGWHDMGANRRRMKNITQALSTSNN